MSEEKLIEKVAVEPERPAKSEDVHEQQIPRTRVKVQSDVRAGITQGNGSLYP